MPADAIPDSRTKKLFPKEWLEIIALAEGGKPVKDIAQAYGVDQSVVYKGLRKRKVNLKAAAIRAESEEFERNKTELLKKIKDTKDFEYRIATFLQQQIAVVANNTVKNGDRHGASLNDMKALKIALEGIKTGSEIKWRLLGLDRENEHADEVLPELPISEMTDLEVHQMREQQELEDGLSPGELEAMLDGINGEEESDDDAIVDEAPDDE